MIPRYLPPSARINQIKKQAPVVVFEKTEPEAKPMGTPVPKPMVAKRPEYNDRMLKSDLSQMAEDVGLDVTDSTKAEILTALDGHYGTGD